MEKKRRYDIKQNLNVFGGFLLLAPKPTSRNDGATNHLKMKQEKGYRDHKFSQLTIYVESL